MAMYLADLQRDIQRANARSQAQQACQQPYVPQGPVQPLTTADMVGCLRAIVILGALGLVVIGLAFIAG